MLETLPSLIALPPGMLYVTPESADEEFSVSFLTGRRLFKMDSLSSKFGFKKNKAKKYSCYVSTHTIYLIPIEIVKKKKIKCVLGMFATQALG